ncbi:MAG: type VI secretion system tube protein Hcp [Candidatus Peribacteraceae bacterium]|jgi:type VI protein secretion system component Hcp
MKYVIRLLALFAVLIPVIGWTAARAQTLSGNSIIFDTQNEESSLSSSAGNASSPVTHFGTDGSPSSSIASESFSAIRESFPVGVSLRLLDFPITNQSVDIPLQSYGISVERQDRAATGGPRSFSVVMRENLASPRLFLAAAAGDRLASAVISVRTQNAPQELLRWTLSGVTVLSYASVSATGEAIPLDTLTLGFERITFQVTPLLPNGDTGPAIQSGWDVRRQRPL